MTTHTLDFNNIERKFFWILIVLISSVTGFYLYSVFSLTMAGVDRTMISRHTQELKNKVSVLEAEYLAQTNLFTEEYAQSLGLYEVHPKFSNQPLHTVVAKAPY